MADLQVRCVSKGHHAVEGITDLGGDGWRWTRDQVVEAIDGRLHTFFTVYAGTRAPLEVVTTMRGKYIRTRGNGTSTDNLLSLPACAA